MWYACSRSGGIAGQRVAVPRGVGLEQPPVALERRPPLGEDRVPLLELAVQVGGQHVGQPERRADVLPRVLVDLAEQELAPVGALVVHDVGPVDVGLAVDDQRAALAADEVLGLVEAQRGEAAEAAERAAPVAAEQAVRVVLDELGARASARAPAGCRRCRSPPPRSGWARPRGRCRPSARPGGPGRARACAPRCRRTGCGRPARANASAVVTKPNDGTTTVSPGPRSSSRAVISSAAVHDVVSRTSCAPSSSCSRPAARAENGPAAEVCPARPRPGCTRSRGPRCSAG